MGRKAYLEDLAAAKQLIVPDISDVLSGEDGELSFGFRFSEYEPPVQITATVLEPSDYPVSHGYMLFAEDSATPAVSAAVEGLPDLSRKSIAQLLSAVASNLKGALHGRVSKSSRSAPESITSSTDLEKAPEYDDDDDFDMGNAENEDWLAEDDYDLTTFSGPSQASHNLSTFHSLDQQRVQQDLGAAKSAGFKVGILGSLRANSSFYVSISSKITKLGISEEAMQAWSVEPSEYLVLLMYYPSGYRDMDFVNERDTGVMHQHLEFRTAICSSYKPASAEQARTLFMRDHSKRMPSNSNVNSAGVPVTLRETFISGPLNTLLKEQFPAMLRYRLNRGFSWGGAERYYNESMGKHAKAASDLGEEYHIEPDRPRPGLPEIVTADELLERLDEEALGLPVLSLPLIAMQYLLRHFVRCVDFCQICHCRLDMSVEAIKPYVCDNPLCLFQYLSLGFGPKIEQEILTQPLVVDLLVGFCYVAARNGRLRELPALDWQVPDPRSPIHGLNPTLCTTGPHGGALLQAHTNHVATAAASAIGGEGVVTRPRVRYSEREDQLLFEEGTKCPVQKGAWLVVNFTNSQDVSYHCRVLDTAYFPTISLSKPVKIKTATEAHPVSSSQAMKADSKENNNPVQSSSTEPVWIPVTLHAYNASFQNLSKEDKSQMIVLLCDLLPKVTEMRDYILARPGTNLASWHDRIPPASLGVLRWIIASNRSAILAVDELPVKSIDSEVQLKAKKAEHRVPGVGSWLQFRFAMGSPDKERRFIESLQQGSAEFPTLFAWHGSPISNWHSIIRQGLDYSETAHGRAHGHGCYHAKDWQTSMGYSGTRSGHFIDGWTQSILHVGNAIALSEIVNAPEKFTSQNPFYVVAQTEWIQTRYLFAQLAPTSKLKVAPDAPISPSLRQDPQRTPTGPGGHKLDLPLTTVPRSRRPGASQDVSSTITQSRSAALTSKQENGDQPKRKKPKMIPPPPSGSIGAGTSAQDAIDLDAMSEATLEEDRDLFYDLHDTGLPTPPEMDPCTPFTPAPLVNVPSMPPPIFATPNATRSLQKTFRTLLAVQEDHVKQGRLPELGWYADARHLEKNDNLYQWMVELHSFPLKLPLAQDLEAANIDSILLELRFSASFPFSPPFVRVVKPRFLPFQSGGGGHVTAGGSICMDLLTTSGWTAVASIESVLLQIRMAMMSCEPRPARLEGTPSDYIGGGEGKGQVTAKMLPGQSHQREYGVGEAVEAFIRACRTHGWEVPKDLTDMTTQRKG